MSYLNLMGNKLKPKEVNDALEEGGGSSLPDVGPEDAGQALMVSDTGEWEADEIVGLLPEVDTTDAGKVLTVSDTGEWEADEIVGLLPEVDTTDAGKVLTVSDTGEWEATTLSFDSVVKKVEVRTTSTSSTAASISVNGVEYSYTSQDLPITVNGLTINYDSGWKATSNKNVIKNGTLSNNVADTWSYADQHNVDYYVFD